MNISPQDEVFLVGIETYLTERPHLTPYVVSACSKGVQAAFERSAERAADLEVALSYALSGHKSGHKYLAAFRHVLRILDKWQGRTVLRWDHTVEQVTARMKNVEAKLTKSSTET